MPNFPRFPQPQEGPTAVDEEGDGIPDSFDPVISSVATSSSNNQERPGRGGSTKPITSITSYSSSGTVAYKTKTIYATVTAGADRKADSQAIKSTGLSSGAIAGVVVGSSLVLLAVLGLIFSMNRRRKHRVSRTVEETSSQDYQQSQTHHEKRSEGTAELPDRPVIFEPNSNAFHELETPVSELEAESPTKAGIHRLEAGRYAANAFE